MHIVSILVFLDLALRERRWYMYIGGFCVSILVFLDLALREHEMYCIATGFSSFNPCFLGSCSPSSRGLCGSYHGWVSILVFLDLALRARQSSMIRRRIARFNPCFLGSCSPRASLVASSSSVSTFQSLFSWILLSESLRDIGSPVRITFQSLFSWILLSESDIFLRRIRNFSVSILVFLDLALRDLIWKYWVTTESSFNPCFLGSCSPSSRANSNRSSRGLFQSLFSWILLSEGRAF